MIITKECRAKNKLGLLLILTRADEALLTMLEHEYDEEEQVEITEEELEYMGLEFELQRNLTREYTSSAPLFDELETLCDALANEIQDNDWEIHFDKKYGYEGDLEEYINEKWIIID